MKVVFLFKSCLSIFTTAWILFNNDISGYLGDNSSIGKNLHCQIVEIFCNLSNVIYWKKRKILAIMSKNLKNSGLSASLCRCWVAEPRRESVGYWLHLAFFLVIFSAWLTQLQVNPSWIVFLHIIRIMKIIKLLISLDWRLLEAFWGLFFTFQLKIVRWTLKGAREIWVRFLTWFQKTWNCS